MPLHSTVKYKSQQGAALLIFMLILVMASSYSLLRKMNATTKPYLRQEATSKVLAEAKQVLIGYALTYPENNAGFGPGYLPCPDRSNDGFINAGACASSTATTIGRFPWRSLGVREMTDSSGARLWYVLSDNYRNNPKINSSGGFMNSDNAGQLTLDGTSDVVALIISPGETVGNQSRDASEFDIADEIANYLEGENADIAAAYDVDFATSDAGDFNDKVIAITRQELMAVIEKRVLGEVEEAMNNYQNTHAASPWLSPFADPSTSTFRGANNTWQGHLPFHWAADPDSIDQGGAIAGRNPFTTDISLTWAITNADVTDPGETLYNPDFSGYEAYRGKMTTPDIDCAENSTCTDGNYAGLSLASPIVFTDASCTWSTKAVLQCTGSYVNTILNSYPQQTVSGWGYSFNVGPDEVIYINDGVYYVLGEGLAIGWNLNTQIQYAYTETVTRTYTVDITYTDTTIDSADVNSPTTGAVRTRDLTVDSNDTAAALYSSGTTSITLTIVDNRQIDSTYSDASPLVLTATSTRILTNDADTSGSMAATGILYDIDVDDEELPSWFVSNGWQDLIYIAYASGEPLPGNTAVGQDCATLVTSCITANINGMATNNVRAVVFSAGVDLTSGTARPNGTLSDYFDDDNNDLDDVIDKKRITAAYNDQTRVISTAP